MNLKQEIRYKHECLNKAMDELKRLIPIEEAQDNIYNLKSVIIPRLENDLVELMLERESIKNSIKETIKYYKQTIDSMAIDEIPYDSDYFTNVTQNIIPRLELDLENI